MIFWPPMIIEETGWIIGRGFTFYEAFQTYACQVSLAFTDISTWLSLPLIKHVKLATLHVYAETLFSNVPTFIILNFVTMVLRHIHIWFFYRMLRPVMYWNTTPLQSRVFMLHTDRQLIYLFIESVDVLILTHVFCYVWYVNFIYWVAFYYAPRKISGEHIVVALSVRPSVRQSVRPSVRPIRVRPITSLFEVGF